VPLTDSPKRIISLVPSQTELLVDLGLEKEIVGITKFCIHPAHLLKTKTIIGGTKKFNFTLINHLRPDLIFGNKEENYQKGIEQLQEKYPVWISDIENLDDALAMIATVGELTGKVSQASQLTTRIKDTFAELPHQPSVKKVAYFIWENPYMVAASRTFVDHMLKVCGFNNVFAHLERYPQITEAQLAEAKPDVIFLSSEPYPFKNKHLQQFREMCPQATIQLVDGEMFSWYGSRLLHAPAYFQKLLTHIEAT
jgi:ABC-type Fe3+-hydroxamate transport system substrate-binding protein